MKQRMAAVVAAVILLGLGVAVAVGGATSDPMVAKSYLENTYLAQLADLLQARASKQTEALYQSAVERLDAMGEQDVKTAEATEVGDSADGAYTPTALATGERLGLQTGASVVLYHGQAKLESGALADVTSGETLTSDGALSVAHRYIVLADAVVQQTATGRLGHQGTVSHLKAGESAGSPGGSGGGGGGSTEVSAPFVDVTASDWYNSAVSFVYQKGYFSGTGESRFSPNASMTRAMLATVLYRMSGESVKAEASAFRDVPTGEWFAEGVTWASQAGVVNGMGDGTFHPQEPVTRQQMVTMLYRYQKEYRGKTGTKSGDLNAFPDGTAVATWAKEAMVWAVGEGLLTGRDTGALDPAGTATRAEVATLLQRFVTLLGDG